MKAKQSTGHQRQAIIWGRFSSSQQSDGDSKDRQERLNRATAKREGIKVIKEYFDSAVSVREGATEKFKQVIAELPSGVGIITENLDRINRGHPWRAKAYIADLLEQGHYIITSQDGREYNNESIEQLDTLVLGDMATNVARYENSKRIKRVRDAKKEAIELARQGKPSPLGAWLPSHLRYNFETGKYDFKQDIADIAERIFTEYRQGKGTSNIARGLNNDGIPTFRRDKKWGRSNVAWLLRYEGWIGILNIKGERIAKAFPPAIKEQLFYAVQKMLEGNKNRHGKYDGERVNNVFRGLCHCSECGSSVKVYNRKYIRCGGYREGKCTLKQMIPFPEMERELLLWFIPQAKDALLGKGDAYSRIDTLQGKQKAIQQRIEQTLTLLDEGLAVAEVRARLARLEKERHQVERKLAEARAEASSKASLPDTLKQLDTLINDSIDGNQEVRKKVASLVPTLIKDIRIDIRDKVFPSFKVILIDGQVLEWEYDVQEFSQRLIALGANGSMLLGKVKVTEGGYKGKQ